MIDGGYSSLNVDKLVTEVGTTRPTFYRRYPNIDHLAFEVIRNRFQTATDVATGTLAGDLLKLQREEVSMFSDPLIRKNLPGLLESIRTNPEVGKLYADLFIRPRREKVGLVIKAAVNHGEIPHSNIDVEFVCDILLGPLLTRVLLPVDVALDDKLARQTAQLALLFISGESTP